LTKGGGRAGLISEQNLLSALARPYSGYHRPIARKCAALLHSMVKNHPFVDANKRTAWLVTNILIVRSGYVIRLAASDRIDDLVVSVAEDGIAFDDLVEWFRRRLSR
jgi:death-on-curing protein